MTCACNCTVYNKANFLYCSKLRPGLPIYLNIHLYKIICVSEKLKYTSFFFLYVTYNIDKLTLFKGFMKLQVYKNIIMGISAKRFLLSMHVRTLCKLRYVSCTE